MKLKTITSISAVTLVVGLVLVSLNTLNYGRRSLVSVDRKLQIVEDSTPAYTPKPVIVVLIHEQTSLEDLCQSMRTLVNVEGSAPVLAFHLETTPGLNQQNHLQQCTTRPVYFAVVDLHDFPVGFVPEVGVDYTSAQINRFWTSGIWKHVAMYTFNVVMKIDHDTCFSMQTALPNFSTPYQSYKSHYFPGTVDLNPLRLGGMHDFFNAYRLGHNIDSKHEMLFNKVHFSWVNWQNLPNFQDSFELISKDFMLREDVNEWLTALTDLPPYGYLTDGWSFRAERFLTMALFGTPSSVDLKLVQGFIEKDLLINNRHLEACAVPFE